MGLETGFEQVRDSPKLAKSLYKTLVYNWTARILLSVLLIGFGAFLSAAHAKSKTAGQAKTVEFWKEIWLGSNSIFGLLFWTWLLTIIFVIASPLVHRFWKHAQAFAS